MAVSFNDLDRDLMCGLLTNYTRLINDEGALKRDTPIGRWSKYNAAPDPVAGTSQDAEEDPMLDLFSFSSY